MTLKRVVPEILKVVQIVVMDSHMQRLRVGVQPGTDWFSKNSLIIQMIEIVSQCKSIRKKLFLNYPFSVYQTRRSGAAKEIMNSVTLIKQSQPDFFEKKAKQICKDFKINSTVFYSSLVQVYLREQMAGEFFIVEVPYLIPGVKDFRGLYLPQFNVLDDIIIFMRDGMMDRIDAPYTALVPMVPVDIVCQFLLNNMLSSTAMINNFYGCPLRWTVFFYIVSDHFTVHSASNAYSGPEIRAQEVEGNTAKVGLGYHRSS